MAIHRGYKQCPFCGQEANEKISHVFEDSDWLVEASQEEETKAWIVECLTCDCRGPLGETKEEAIGFWNYRHGQNEEEEKQSDTK